ncbi:MAG: hypothetical protein Rubg2KO_26460 [Rubricoccaceae bacterium]
MGSGQWQRKENGRDGECGEESLHPFRPLHLQGSMQETPSGLAIVTEPKVDVRELAVICHWLLPIRHWPTKHRGNANPDRTVGSRNIPVTHLCSPTPSL